MNYILFCKNPVRIKDITIIDGLKDNQLMGFGLVTGLQGRGDSKGFKLTQKMLQNLAINHGFNIDENDINSKNIAAVLVTAVVGPFTRTGDLVDVQISSIGDSKSLEGGILLQTPLRGADGIIYAVSQGRIISGSISNNTQATASIPDGAIIENNIISNYINNNKINIILKYPDFVTAVQIAQAILAINQKLVIKTIDAGLIEITLTDEELKNPADFISKLEILTVTPDYASAVVIDKKTGAIIMGEDIVIQNCIISTPFAQVTVGNKNKKSNLQINLKTISELINVLNDSGLTNNEIISLLEGIHKLGAINARLIIL